MNILKKLFPFISAAASLGGPLGSMAANALGNAIGVGNVKDTSVDGLSKMIAGATPDQLIAAQAAEQNFQIQMAKLGFDDAEAMAKMNYDDTANARAREVQTKDSWTPRIIAGFVILAWVFVQGFLLVHAFSAKPELTPSMSQLVGAISRMADAALMLVLGYYFGSSIGSQNKDLTIQNLSK